MSLTTRPPVIAGLRPEPNRDRYGRYLLPDPRTGDTRPWTRATTVAHTLDNTEPLTAWKRRKVLEGAAADPGLLTHVPALADQLLHADGQQARELKQALDEICDQAANHAGANDGSGWGTALHTVTEYHDAGRITDIDIPIDLLADLAAYEHCLTENRIGRPVEYIERILVNTTVDSAGTTDRILRLPDGRLVIGDLKSQQKIYDWLAIAMQLAQYAHSDCLINPDTGQPEDMPADLDLNMGIVIHLPARSGQCQLYEVDLRPGWEAAKLAHRIRQIRSDARTWGHPYSPPAPPEHTQMELVDTLLTAIRLAPDGDTLTRLWAGHKTTWTDGHTEAAKHRKAQLNSSGRIRL